MEIIHLLTLSGSRAYGFETPESDTDYRGIMWNGDLTHVLGYNKFDCKETKSPDTVLHSLPKFMSLTLTGSFNSLDVLWAPDDAVVHLDDWGKHLRSIRTQLLASQVLANSCIGFAKGQYQFVSRNRPEERAKREGTVVLEDYSRQYRKAQHHSLRVLWQAEYCFKNGVWPVRVKDFDPEMAVCLRAIKENAAPYDAWKACFDEALDRVKKAEQSTILPHDFCKEYWEQYVIRYRLWLIKTLQETRDQNPQKA